MLPAQCLSFPMLALVLCEIRIMELSKLEKPSEMIHPALTHIPKCHICTLFLSTPKNEQKAAHLEILFSSSEVPPTATFTKNSCVQQGLKNHPQTLPCGFQELSELPQDPLCSGIVLFQCQPDPELSLLAPTAPGGGTAAFLPTQPLNWGSRNATGY